MYVEDKSMVVKFVLQANDENIVSISIRLMYALFIERVRSSSSRENILLILSS